MKYITIKDRRYRRCEPVWRSCRLRAGHRGQHDAHARGGKRRGSLPKRGIEDA
jgi:hypothetical protein